ncbi:MAG: hypothetical protein LUF35_05930 [Lachnospiraceae bacterium]|nr:hypothetical protein [Lachnospiraceae bacterium]
MADEKDIWATIKELEEVVEFCEKFELDYLKQLMPSVERFLTLVSSVDATLGCTDFANKASPQLKTIAYRLGDVTYSGIYRMREHKEEAAYLLIGKTPVVGLPPWLLDS